MEQSVTQQVLACHMLISGQVQGVFYRATMADKANALGLSGWCRNLPDGRVEAFAQGRENQIDALVDWAYEGSAQAEVAQVEITESEPDPGLANGFEVRK